MKKKSSFPITVQEGFAQVKIYQGKQKDGTPFYSVQYWQDGKRIRQSFTDLARAQVEANSRVKKLASGDALALQLSGLDRATYLRAQEKVRPTGVPLDTAAGHFAEAVAILGSDLVVEAAKEYARRHPQNIVQKSVEEVVSELIKAKRKAKRSERHLDDLRNRLGAFAKAFQCPIQSITGEDVRRYLDGNDWAPVTFLNHFRAINILIRFAKVRKYLPKDFDALEGIELPEEEDGEIEIFTPTELALILEHARPEMIPFLTIGAFAGIRTAEIARLDWSEVRNGFIEVKARKAKTASRRLAPIIDNLAAWLAPYRKESGRIVQFKKTAKQIEFLVEDINAALKAKAEKDGRTFQPFKWKRNGLRHSYISYRVAQVQDVGRVALEAGNSPAMIFKNYREIVTPDEAASWFSIMPNIAENIISMPAVVVK